MSATPPPPPTPTTTPEWTEADRDAMFASVVWFRTHIETGAFDKYAGKYVAILGEQVIDADGDKNELLRRLAALGDKLPPNRVVLQYVQTAEEAWLA